ncbi:MAG: hypothetical protein A4E27_01735 [Methanobacterium sp. PtaU1.Bin242]|nr:MAG: hypothetical protein A4E27_01735 [Methanobacterium sp. PtaU1.Bin242]
MVKKLELKEIVLIGRSFEEYNSFFELAEIDNDNRILDVASGVSSFAAEANLKGCNVTAMDIIYGFSPYEIGKKCAQDLKIIIEKLDNATDHYQWNFFKDIADYERNAEGHIKNSLQILKKMGTDR